MNFILYLKYLILINEFRTWEKHLISHFLKISFFCNFYTSRVQNSPSGRSVYFLLMNSHLGHIQQLNSCTIGFMYGHCQARCEERGNGIGICIFLSERRAVLSKKATGVVSIQSLRVFCRNSSEELASIRPCSNDPPVCCPLPELSPFWGASGQVLSTYRHTRCIIKFPGLIWNFK